MRSWIRNYWVSL